MSPSALCPVSSVTLASGSCALSPLNGKLFVVNQEQAIDIYTIISSRIAYETSMVVDLDTWAGSVNMFVPIAFVHDGAGIMIGSTSGVVRVLSAAFGTKQGSTLQTYRAEDENSQWSCSFIPPAFNHNILTLPPGTIQEIVRLP